MDDETVIEICAGECGAACCSGDIFVGEADANRLYEAGYEGFLSSDTMTKTMRTDDKNQCYFLDTDDQCTIYNDRPIDCQLFPFGFIINDDVIDIVLVNCPLSTRMSETLITEMLAEVKNKIAAYTPADLEAYDSLSFTNEYKVIESVSRVELMNE